MVWCSLRAKVNVPRGPVSPGRGLASRLGDLGDGVTKLPGWPTHRVRDLAPVHLWAPAIFGLRAGAVPERQQAWTRPHAAAGLQAASDCCRGRKLPPRAPPAHRELPQRSSSAMTTASPARSANQRMVCQCAHSSRPDAMKIVVIGSRASTLSASPRLITGASPQDEGSAAGLPWRRSRLPGCGPQPGLARRRGCRPRRELFNSHKGFGAPDDPHPKPRTLRLLVDHRRRYARCAIRASCRSENRGGCC